MNAARDAFRGPEIKLLMPCVTKYSSSVPSYGLIHVGARCGVGARIAPPFIGRQPMRVDWCVSSWFRIKNTHSHVTRCRASGQNWVRFSAPRSWACD